MKEKIISFVQKNKILLILALIAMVIIVITSLSGQKTTKTSSPTPTPENNTGIPGFGTPVPISKFTPPPYSQPTLDAKGQVNLDSKEVKEATANKQKLGGSLPIYVPNFSISNGMKTTLNVYTIPEDPNYLIHIDIYGVNYEEQSTDKTNPNVVAFIESFQEIKKRLTTKGVNIKNIYFIFGGPEFVQKTAELWLKTFNLL